MAKGGCGGAARRAKRLIGRSLAAMALVAPLTLVGTGVAPAGAAPLPGTWTPLGPGPTSGGQVESLGDLMRQAS